MKKTLLFIISVFVLNYNYGQSVKGNGDVVIKERTVGPFTSIETSHGWDLKLTQGSAYKMTIETDENLVDYVKTEVSGNTLKIYSDVNIIKSSKRTIHLTFKELGSIEASGGSDIQAEDKIQTKDFEIKCSGGSDLSLRQIACNNFKGNFSGGSDASIGLSSVGKVEIDARGGSDIRLKNISGTNLSLELYGGSDAALNGRVEALTLKGSGGSDVSALNLEVAEAKIDLSGSSDGKFNIKEKLDLNLSGGSDFYCQGDPNIVHQNVCKSCDVRM